MFISRASSVGRRLLSVRDFADFFAPSAFKVHALFTFFIGGENF